MSILIENVSKRFQAFQALQHINLEIPTGSLLALVGPSGSGKSTLLRVIAGLDKPDQGRVWLSERNGNLLSIQDRDVGFVFQNYALFKRLTAYENIAFGLHIRHFSAIIVEKRVKQLINLVQLERLEHRYPHQLSGGQRQRVALARALAIEPKILLLDEPFGAVDMKIRKQLRSWLRTLHEQVAVTTVLVTHDQKEAMGVANAVVILERGRVKYIGDPQEIMQDLYHIPTALHPLGRQREGELLEAAPAT